MTDIRAESKEYFHMRVSTNRERVVMFYCLECCVPPRTYPTHWPAAAMTNPGKGLGWPTGWAGTLYQANESSIYKAIKSDIKAPADTANGS